MLPDRVSNPGPLTYESDALPIALRGPALCFVGWKMLKSNFVCLKKELHLKTLKSDHFLVKLQGEELHKYSFFHFSPVTCIMSMYKYL